MVILYIFRDKAKYWSKIAIFHTPLYLRIPGKKLRIFLKCFLHNRVRWLGYDVMQKIAEKLNTLSRYSTVVTDRQTTDTRQTESR